MTGVCLVLAIRGTRHIPVNDAIRHLGNRLSQLDFARMQPTCVGGARDLFHGPVTASTVTFGHLEAWAEFSLIVPR